MSQAKMGKVSASRDGQNMRFDCECGEYEVVIGYDNGTRPKKFIWEASWNSMRSFCKTCKSEHKATLESQYR